MFDRYFIVARYAVRMTTGWLQTYVHAYLTRAVFQSNDTHSNDTAHFSIHFGCIICLSFCLLSVLHC